MSLNLVELMPFRKFCYKNNLTWSEDKIWIEGSFKEKGSKKIFKKDTFEACKVSGLSIEKIYKLYLEWFNYTIQRPDEKERTFFSVRKLSEKEIRELEK